MNHQVGNGLSPALPAGVKEGHRRVDAGVPRVEFEAPGRIASAVGENEEKSSGKPGK